MIAGKFPQQSAGVSSNTRRWSWIVPTSEEHIVEPKVIDYRTRFHLHAAVCLSNGHCLEFARFTNHVHSCSFWCVCVCIKSIIKCCVISYAVQNTHQDGCLGYEQVLQLVELHRMIRGGVESNISVKSELVRIFWHTTQHMNYGTGDAWSRLPFSETLFDIGPQ